MQTNERAIKRFLSKVNKTIHGCWLWTGATQDSAWWYNRTYGKCRNPNLRGKFWLNGATELAHRASWLLFRGPIDPGLVVAHDCDVGLCVNPDHLFLATVVENIEDAKQKRRAKVA